MKALNTFYLEVSR